MKKPLPAKLTPVKGPKSDDMRAGKKAGCRSTTRNGKY